jgi:hypothetical protein
MEAALNTPLATNIGQPLPPPQIDLPAHPTVSYGKPADAALSPDGTQVEDELQAAAEEVHKKLAALDAPKPTAEESKDSPSDKVTAAPAPLMANEDRSEGEASTSVEHEAEIPLFKTKSTPREDESEHDTIAIDADGTLRIRE